VAELTAPMVGRRSSACTGSTPARITPAPRAATACA
jgi:hypothetical protein